MRREVVILGNRALPNQSRLYRWKLDGSIQLAWWRRSKLCSCVGRTGLLGILEHVMVLQMSVVLEKEFYLSHEVHNELMPSYFLGGYMCINVCIPF